MQDEFRILAAAHATAAAPLLPACGAAPERRAPAANEESFLRSRQFARFRRTTRRHLLMLGGFMAGVLLLGAWVGQGTGQGPLALSLLYVFGGCVPAGLAAVQVQQAHSVARAFAQRRREPLEAASHVAPWREALAFAAGAAAFAGLAYGLLG
ncbi:MULTISPECIES: hypothetical protein [Ramlibacter]|uniref:DUF2269 family protein n=1 Tax=Ramlibacter aquaticus TaxID=2780094 RepID=A0ABR9SI83_9BURK|nr:MULTISPECIES: hypothetical protein [Ramlibacter]MBE7942058.1 hypothetical protein [Ramlibacter aquaticus]